MKIACIQMDIVFGEPEKNMELVEKQMEQLFQENNADVVVLPELWTTGYDLTRLDEIADERGQTTTAFLASLAKRYNTNIVGGSVATKMEQGVTNTMYVANRQGDIITEYSKVHLFRLMDEHLYLTAGTNKGMFEIDGVQSAGVICYDIRFPEWIRTHTIEGAQVVYVVAEWPKPRLHHWRTLLMSRAIENQCYVVACNRVGNDHNNIFGGHSMIIDPWGEVLAEAADGIEIIEAELDFTKVTEIRSQIPIFQDRRANLYE